MVCGVLLGAASMGALAGTAVAASCNTGDSCLWQDSSYIGGFYFHSGSDSNLHNDEFARNVPVGDNASSLENHGTETNPDDVRYYWDIGWSGHDLCIVNTPGENQRADLTAIPAEWDDGDPSNPSDRSWNDDISSFMWVNSCFA
jgi:hypothetical protein